MPVLLIPSNAMLPAASPTKPILVPDISDWKKIRQPAGLSTKTIQRADEPSSRCHRMRKNIARMVRDWKEKIATLNAKYRR